MVERYIDEDTGDFLSFVFVLLEVIWLIVIIALNLPKVIGSLLFSQLGRFPFNIGTFFVLLYTGGIMILIVVRFFARLFSQEISNKKEV